MLNRFLPALATRTGEAAAPLLAPGKNGLFVTGIALSTPYLNEAGLGFRVLAVGRIKE